MADPTQGDPSQFQTPFDLQVANTPNFINAAYSTPQQRAQLYAYANALTQPGQVKNGWQGIGEIARALTGGYVGHLADQYEGQNYAHNLDQTTPQGGAAPAPPVAAPGGSAPPASAPAASASPMPNNGPYGGLERVRLSSIRGRIPVSAEICESWRRDAIGDSPWPGLTARICVIAL